MSGAGSGGPRRSALPPPSDEQLSVVQAVLDGNDVIVDSVAGSGKTTTVLHVAAAMPHAQILLLTYNARLKEETRVRVQELGIRNIEVHSYHAAAVRYYDTGAHNETVFAEVIRENKEPRTILPCWNVLVIDEAQDVTLRLFQLVCKLLRDCASRHGPDFKPQYVVVGDENQCIYRYRGSDPRYLTLANAAFRLPRPRTGEGAGTGSAASGSDAGTETDHPWVRRKLSTSYRVTAPMARFVNDIMLGRHHMSSGRQVSNPTPVRYLVGNVWKMMANVAKEIADMIKAGRRPDDIFILAGSMKSSLSENSKAPLRKLNECLTELLVPVFVKGGDGEFSLNKDDVKGKVCMTTLHSTKGLERPIVYVCGFEKSYFTYFCRPPENDMICPNPLYVGATRATEQLVLLAEAVVGKHLPFLNRKQLLIDQGLKGPSAYARIEAVGHFATPPTVPKPAEAEARVEDLEKRLVVTGLLDHVPDNLLEKALGCIAWREIQPKTRPHKLRVTVDVSDAKGVSTREQVAHLNGLAIPAMLEARIKGSCEMYQVLQQVGRTDVPAVYKDSLQYHLKHPPPPADAPPSAFLKLAALYHGVAAGGYPSDFRQLGDSYNWLDSEQAQPCIDTLADALPQRGVGAEFEAGYKTDLTWTGCSPHRSVTIEGQTDVKSGNDIWEVKCTKELRKEHILQLALYAWLIHRNDGKAQGAQASGSGTAAAVGTATEVDFEEEEEEAPSGTGPCVGPLPRRTFRLINICTGETMELDWDGSQGACQNDKYAVTDADPPGCTNLDKMVNVLLTWHFRTLERASDEAWLAAVAAARDDGIFDDGETPLPADKRTLSFLTMHERIALGQAEEEESTGSEADDAKAEGSDASASHVSTLPPDMPMDSQSSQESVVLVKPSAGTSRSSSAGAASSSAGASAPPPRKGASSLVDLVDDEEEGAYNNRRRGGGSGPTPSPPNNDRDEDDMGAFEEQLRALEAEAAAGAGQDGGVDPYGLSSNRTPIENGPPCRECLKPTVSRTSQTPANPGRKFWACKTKDHPFGGWCDEVGHDGGSSFGAGTGTGGMSGPVAQAHKFCGRCRKTGHHAGSCPGTGSSAARSWSGTGSAGRVLGTGSAPAPDEQAPQVKGGKRKRATSANAEGGEGEDASGRAPRKPRAPRKCKRCGELGHTQSKCGQQSSSGGGGGGPASGTFALDDDDE